MSTMTLPENHRYWPDLRYYAVATPDTHVIDFKVYEVVADAVHKAGVTRPCLTFQCEGYTQSGDWTEDVAAASVWLAGAVKWDGCSDWDFAELSGRGFSLHFCGWDAAVDLGTLLDRLYGWASDLMGYDRIDMGRPLTRPTPPTG